jgi:hypothetical protein
MAEDEGGFGLDKLGDWFSNPANSVLLGQAAQAVMGQDQNSWQAQLGQVAQNLGQSTISANEEAQARTKQQEVLKMLLQNMLAQAPGTGVGLTPPGQKGDTDMTMKRKADGTYTYTVNGNDVTLSADGQPIPTAAPPVGFKKSTVNPNMLPAVMALMDTGADTNLRGLTPEQILNVSKNRQGQMAQFLQRAELLGNTQASVDARNLANRQQDFDEKKKFPLEERKVADAENRTGIMREEVGVQKGNLSARRAEHALNREKWEAGEPIRTDQLSTIKERKAAKYEIKVLGGWDSENVSDDLRYSADPDRYEKEKNREMRKDIEKDKSSDPAAIKAADRLTKELGVSFAEAYNLATQKKELSESEIALHISNAIDKDPTNRAKDEDERAKMLATRVERVKSVLAELKTKDEKAEQKITLPDGAWDEMTLTEKVAWKQKKEIPERYKPKKEKKPGKKRVYFDTQGNIIQ